MDKEEYKQAVKEANRASEVYYNTSNPIMSDAQFDQLVDSIAQYEKETGDILSSSPTQRVGATVLSSLNKVQITPRPMLSLAKCHTAGEIEDFMTPSPLIAMVKLDGLSVRLKYQNGKLVSANTRGNGYEGTDVTEHVKQFKNVPLTIPFKGSYIIDGEAVIKLDDFQNLTGLANPRNAASGALNVLDTSVTKERHLSFVAWDVIEPNDTNSFYRNLKKAKEMGFTIVPLLNNPVMTTIDEANKKIIDMAKEQSYPCDGVVWRYDNIAFGNSLGMTSHAPRYAIAWKPEIKATQSILRNIVWQGGRSNKLTPVAEFDSIDIDGSAVERASLHNYSIMVETLGEHPWEGELVDVYKANLIIPQILEGYGDESGHKRIELPTVCPYCGQPITKEEHNGVIDICCNNPECNSKLINRLVHFCGKSGLNIKGLSKATLQKLLDWQWVDNFESLFKLSDHREAWIHQPGWGEKSVDNILNAISSSERTELWRVISAAGIPLIGVGTAKQLANYFGTWDDFREAVGHFDFTQLSDIAEQTANKINNYNYTQIDIIMDKYITCAPIRIEEVRDQPLKGQTFCITGSLEHFKNRDELKQKIEALGGKVAGSVTSNTSFLINNDLESTSSKNNKAKSLGIPIISEKEFLEKNDL